MTNNQQNRIRDLMFLQACKAGFEEEANVIKQAAFEALYTYGNGPARSCNTDDMAAVLDLIHDDLRKFLMEKMGRYECDDDEILDWLGDKTNKRWDLG